MAKKVLIDTNILISAALNPSGTPARAIQHAMDSFDVCISKYNLEELRRFNPKKAGTRFIAVQNFVAFVEKTMKVIEVPSSVESLEMKIRDVNDRPILRAAIESGVEIIITGDRDFLESGIENPRIMTASEFLEL